MCNTPVRVKLPDGRYELVPCNHCQGCKVSNIAEWTFRIRQEVLENERKGYGNTFLTLTYDDEHLPADGASVRDVQLFWKRLRKKLENAGNVRYNPKFKYFLVSEYGDQRGRIHYHAIVCGLDFGAISRFYRECWRNGFTYSKPVLGGAVRYVLKYLDKTRDARRNGAIYEAQGVKQPFALFSKGIGLVYFRKNQFDIRELKGYYERGVLRRLPSYIRRKLGLYGEYDAWKMQEDARKAGFKSVKDYLKSSGLARESKMLSNARLHGHIVET